MKQGYPWAADRTVSPQREDVYQTLKNRRSAQDSSDSGDSLKTRRSAQDSSDSGDSLKTRRSAQDSSDSGDSLKTRRSAQDSSVKKNISSNSPFKKRQDLLDLQRYLLNNYLIYNSKGNLDLKIKNSGKHLWIIHSSLIKQRFKRYHCELCLKGL